MTAGQRFTIGSEVACSDGSVGRITRVVVDPVSRVLTHLDVEPRRGQAAGRLVPVELVEGAGEVVSLSCTRAEFEKLEEAVEREFLPAPPGDWGYRPGEMLALPYFGAVGFGAGGPVLDVGAGMLDPGPRTVTYDRVPVGEVEVRRGDQVHATDGSIGHVRGLVVDPRDRHVTHVLLDEGHLWGQKTVAIPIGSVASVEDGVRLTLSKDQVRNLPRVELDDPERGQDA